jgi:hypothetical protein
VTASNRPGYVVGLCFLLLFSTITLGAQQTSPGVSVVLSKQNPLQLRVTVRSLAKARVTIQRSDLPWELRHSITLVAAMPDGECLEQNVAAGDPSPAKISLDPNETVSGDINLAEVFKDLNHAIKKSDIHIFWAFKAPESLNLPRWSGGWILLRRQR